MGYDAHWCYDVVGGALLGVGTTKFFIWLHNRHDEEPSRWRIFAMSEGDPRLAGAQTLSSVGVAYNW
jgi:hypothetical protein